MKQLSRAIKTMLTVAVLLISAPVWAADAPLPSLYERLGGTGPITAVVGKFGDVFGRKTVFEAAVMFFLVGSVLCGLAGSMTMLVASRTLQGIGGGAIMVTSMAVIGEVSRCATAVATRGH